MQKSLMLGLTEKDMQAVVNTYNLTPYYYPTLFPLKENYSLSWKALEANAGLRVAADVVARGATIDKKTREALARIQGDIPKIAIKRTKDENELNEYDIMVAMTQGNPNQRALVEAWAEDTQFCWDGVASRLEWIALQSLSRGKVVLTNDNNNSVVTQFAVDYQIDTTRKLGIQTGSDVWTDSAKAKPISVDFKSVVAKAKAEGINLRYAVMNADTFANFAQTAEVVRLSASFMQNALNIAQTPSLQQVNAAMASLAYLRGLQIVVIDQDITIENSDGTRTSRNPFLDNVVTFVEGANMGNTFWKVPADWKLQGSAAIKALNGHTLVKKYSTEEPIEEVTIGLTNAFPAWLGATRAFLMDTINSTWLEGVAQTQA